MSKGQLLPHEKVREKTLWARIKSRDLASINIAMQISNKLKDKNKQLRFKDTKRV